MERYEKRGWPKDSGGRLIRSTLCAVIFLMILAGAVKGDEKRANDVNERREGKPVLDGKEANEPNELCLDKWEIAVKDPNDANELLKAKCNSVITVLGDKELGQKHKEKIIEKIMNPIFDFELMSKLSLGKTHWSKLTVSEQKRFTELFTEHLKSSYRGNIDLYKDEKAIFKPAVPEKTGVSIVMELISNDEKAEVIYKLRRVEKSWKIYDVEIVGVSILMTYRSQFDDILRRGSVKELFSHLEKEPDQK